jgi:hypothetical protein
VREREREREIEREDQPMEKGRKATRFSRK